MAFIVVEKHGGPEYAIIITDEYGDNKIFDREEEARAEADDCQDGLVIGID